MMSLMRPTIQQNKRSYMAWWGVTEKGITAWEPDRSLAGWTAASTGTNTRHQTRRAGPKCQTVPTVLLFKLPTRISSPFSRCLKSQHSTTLAGVNHSDLQRSAEMSPPRRHRHQRCGFILRCCNPTLARASRP